MAVDYSNPQKYLGEYKACYIGYAQDEGVRSEAASGGVVTSILIYLLDRGLIQGALVTRQQMEDGEIGYKTFIATTKEEILDCRTSVYMDLPLAKHFKEITGFDGKVAVVALPCHLRALSKLEEKYPVLKEKIVLKISLFCSGSPSPELTKRTLIRCRINPSEVSRIYFRKGHWRGETHVEMTNGETKRISYLYNLCMYKNLYYYATPRCYSCNDHFGFNGDISCGDVWLKEMKADPIKHTGIVAKNERAQRLIEDMIRENVISAREIDASQTVKSQKRAVTYKFHCGRAKKSLGGLFGLKYTGEAKEPSRWNHYLAVFLISLNIKASESPFWSRLAFAMPRRLMFLYMGFIRFLLSY